MSFPLKILIAPLDWGLGHTSRCLPLIAELRRQGHEVTAAASGVSAAVIRSNFPDIRMVGLPGYDVVYSRSRRGFKLKLLLQLPKLLRGIRKESRWLQQRLQEYPYDLIISDNRYGLHHRAAPSVIMTHQLQILTGWGAWSERLIRKLHYRQLEKFDWCWVVDEETEGLSGRLGHPGALPRNASYIGCLSQLAMIDDGGGSAEVHSPAAAPVRSGSRAVMILLSGPEPMRTLLETKLWSQLRACPERQFVFVAGKPGARPPGQILPNVRYFSHLNARELKSRMSEAELVISRSGYSTLMDLAAMGKKALLIPTPGQTEQEYLAAFLLSRKIALYKSQKEVSLATDIAAALVFKGFKNPGADFHRHMKTMLRALTNYLLNVSAAGPGKVTRR